MNSSYLYHISTMYYHLSHRFTKKKWRFWRRKRMETPTKHLPSEGLRIAYGSCWSIRTTPYPTVFWTSCPHLLFCYPLFYCVLKQQQCLPQACLTCPPWWPSVLPGSLQKLSPGFWFVKTGCCFLRAYTMFSTLFLSYLCTFDYSRTEGQSSGVFFFSSIVWVMLLIRLGYRRRLRCWELWLLRWRTVWGKLLSFSPYSAQLLSCSPPWCILSSTTKGTLRMGSKVFRQLCGFVWSQWPQ